MDARYSAIAALAATQHSVVSLSQLQETDVHRSLLHRWIELGFIERLGPRSFAFSGCEPTWMRDLTAAFFDLDGRGFVAGRAGARLMGLDGFESDDVELLVLRAHRGARCKATVRSTRSPIDRGDVQRIGCLTVLRAERLIIESPLFGFTRDETENAIDSAIRKRLVSEDRLRQRVVMGHRSTTNGGRVLLDSLVDTGGESRLERWFLKLVRDAGIPRPMLQKVFRADGRTVARVDAFFPGNLVVELAGHATHSSRRARQRDAQRHTELTLRGHRVLTFTYEDLRDRPDWVIAQLRQALVGVA